MRRIDDDPEGASTAVTSKHRGANERTAFVLRVVEGPDSGASASIDETTASPLLVGQSAVCALRLTDREVSRRHLAFELAHDRLRVTDLGSTNGTFVGSLAIADAYLAGGEQLRIGATKLRVDRVPASGATLGTEESFGRLLGKSAAMRRLYPLIARLAAARVPIIVEGETGTGKELLAETLHAAGPRAREPFVVFDCATTGAAHMEAELFGEEARPGVFELAHRGTLLIDEIADLAAPLQSKLLRAIDRGEIRRVGGTELLRVDVRVVATTRKNLDEEVQAGRFREELFYRLAVARIELPPLRKREGDVRLLAEHFVRELGGDLDAATKEAITRWERAPWPGNVRQLRNAVAQHVAEGDLATVDAAPVTHATRDVVDEAIATGLPLPVARLQVVKEFERRYIEAVLEKHGGNVARAAEASGIARRYFQILRGQKRR